MKDHPFFDGIDWEQIEKKTAIPPYIPTDVEYINPNIDSRDSKTTTDPFLKLFSSSKCGSKWLRNVSQDEIGLLAQSSAKDDQQWLPIWPQKETSTGLSGSPKSSSIFPDSKQKYFYDWNFVSSSAVQLEKSTSHV